MNYSHIGGKTLPEGSQGLEYLKSMNTHEEIWLNSSRQTVVRRVSKGVMYIELNSKHEPCSTCFVPFY